MPTGGRTTFLVRTDLLGAPALFAPLFVRSPFVLQRVASGAGPSKASPQDYTITFGIIDRSLSAAFLTRR